MIQKTWLAKPVWPATSPPVVMVATPVRNVRASSGIGTGSQRSGPIGTGGASSGALRQSPASTSVKRPQWDTVGRMR